MRTRVLLAGTAVSVGIFCGSASAAVRPHVAWTLPSSTNAGASTPFTYATRDLRRNEKLVVQRPEGTGQVWKTILTLRGRSGSGAIPAFGVGRYETRIAVIGAPHDKTLVVDERHLSVFGSVPFSTLLARSGSIQDGVQITATGAFSYVLAPSGYGNRPPLAVGANNPCRQVTIQALSYQANESDPGPTSVSVVQQSAEPVAISVGINMVGTVTANLIPGQSWGVNLSSGAQWYLNGSAVCDTTSLPASQ